MTIRMMTQVSTKIPSSDPPLKCPEEVDQKRLSRGQPLT
jgi:hypothetical protein